MKIIERDITVTLESSTVSGTYGSVKKDNLEGIKVYSYSGELATGDDINTIVTYKISNNVVGTYISNATEGNSFTASAYGYNITISNPSYSVNKATINLTNSLWSTLNYCEN